MVPLCFLCLYTVSLYSVLGMPHLCLFVDSNRVQVIFGAAFYWITLGNYCAAWPRVPSFFVLLVLEGRSACLASFTPVPYLILCPQFCMQSMWKRHSQIRTGAVGWMESSSELLVTGPLAASEVVWVCWASIPMFCVCVFISWQRTNVPTGIGIPDSFDLFNFFVIILLI